MSKLRSVYIVVMLLFAVNVSIGQKVIRETKVPLDFTLEFDRIPEQELMHVYLKGDKDELLRVSQSRGWHFKRYTGQYAAVFIPKNQLHQVDVIDEIEAVHFELKQGQALLNDSRVHTRLDRVHNGTAGLPSILTGEGVIMGVIDAGLDLKHPDFLDENGNTRVLHLWDQTLPTTEVLRIPVYGYGQVYDSADINDSLCPHQDQAAWYGHGTNTTGIAVSNGSTNEQYTGCAPKADIIVVSTNFSAYSWTSTVADAVHYIFKKAEEHGRPCVINASIGNYFGSHDGKDVATQEIESFIQDTTGRIMVCAAGNSGEMTPYHLGYETTSDTNFTWFKIPNNATAGNGSLVFDIYGDSGDFESVRFSIGADQVAPSYKLVAELEFDSVQSALGNTISTNLISNNGNYLGEVNYWAEEFNGTYRMRMYVSNIDSINYRYSLRTTGSGGLDIWSSSSSAVNGTTSDMYYDGIPSSTVYPAMVNYKTPDYEQQIVSNWACSDVVITVGNYTNRNEYVDVDENTVEFTSLTPGQIAALSSAGPSHQSSIKPDVAAPGELTITSGASFQIQNQLTNNQRYRVGVGGMHNRAGGTSSASPVVAGIGALFLQHCPNADWADFKTALNSDARSDQFTGNTPNYRWGNGKADAISTLKYLSPHSSIKESVDEFCEGENVTITLNSTGSIFEWNTGATSNPINTDQSGIYFALLENDLGCTGYSDSLTLIKRPIPNSPILVIEGELPACASAPLTVSLNEPFGSYSWSNGSHLDHIEVNEENIVYCTVQNSYGCENVSDSVLLEFHPTQSDPVLILEAGDQLRWITDSTLGQQYQWYLDNELIAEESDSVLYAKEVGIYQASFIDTNGCEWYSNEIQLGVLGSSNVANEGFKVWPNPLTDWVTINSKDQSGEWELNSIEGSMIYSGSFYSSSFKLNLNELPVGIYNLKLISIQMHSQRLLIKQ